MRLPILLCFVSLAAAAAVIPSEPTHVKSLDGKWRFELRHSPKPPQVDPKSEREPIPDPPADNFQQPDYREGQDWVDLAVPGTWEMAGRSPASYYGPDLTAGVYRDWFVVPKSWQGRRVLINFDGIQNGAEIWLNGQPVPVDEPSWGRDNYHESGWTAFQADLTSQVHFGESNLLALYVIKTTPSQDLDSGDYFFLGGVYRPVTLFSIPRMHLDDVAVQTRLLDGNRAEIKVLVSVSNAVDGEVQMRLGGFSGRTIANIARGRAILTRIVEHPKLWSAEFPNLYEMTLELTDPHGHALETFSKKIGIREITIKNGVFLVNGVPVKLAGVCRHDIYPTVGTAVGPDLWRKDISLMKAANINAIRTSHYPYGEGFYDLCDEMGMYVADELPYCWCKPGNLELKPAFLQRARETIRRDKNHPSVILWTIGNENPAGPDLQSVADLVKDLDPTRPRDVSCMDAEKFHVEVSDDHYPDLARIASQSARAKTTGHPNIYLENPNTWDMRLGADAGGWVVWGAVLQRTWEACLKSPTVPGTFIFEWQDRAVADPNPAECYSNRAKFGVQQLECFPETGIRLLKMKGLVDGFRNPRPSLYEVKMVYSPIKIGDDLTITGRFASFAVTNWYSFTDLSKLKLVWKLERSGKAITSGSSRVSLAPLQSGNARLGLDADAVAEAEDLRVDFLDAAGQSVVAQRFRLHPALQTVAGLAANVPLPQFNLVTRVTRRSKKLWRTVDRYPAHLENVVLDPPSVSNLAQLRRLTATVVGGTNNSPDGSLTATFVDGEFSYQLDWTGPKCDVQEWGWIFKAPRACDRFSWDRHARWTVYPPDHIGRAQGVALPDSMNAFYTRMDRPNDFDFDSTKYHCNWARLTSISGDELQVSFDPSQRFDCRAGLSSAGDACLLFVNQNVSPPDDISKSVIPDLYLTLKPGMTLRGRFRVGAHL